MVDMGAEVGQKMRSAIKAKLTELNCYVDDELPDYIMVMVANKRTKTQMNEDLNLFLKGRTSTFVDWLHLVLKKLKEVTVTNLDVYKKASKRKSTEYSDAKINDKKIKKELLKSSKEEPVKQEVKIKFDKCLTDDLPLNVNAKSLTENRRIVLVTNNSKNNIDQSNSSFNNVAEQPRLKELEEIETQIRSVKSRLGLKIDEEVEESELQRIVENSKQKTDVDNVLTQSRQIVIESTQTSEQQNSNEKQNHVEDVHESENNTLEPLEKKTHSKIVFSKEDFISSSSTLSKKKSVLDRLGNYGERKSKSVLSRLGKYTNRSSKSDVKSVDPTNRNKVSKVTCREKIVNVREKYEESVEKSPKGLRSHSSRIVSRINPKNDLIKRLGLSSKVTVPQIDPQLLEDTFKKREVVSVVKVKPRILPPTVQQANKNLLLKAVADAQKSMAQSKSVGRNIQKNTTTLNDPPRKYNEEEPQVLKPKVRKVSQEGKRKLQQFLSNYVEESSDQEYTTPLQKTDITQQYLPSNKQTEEYDLNSEKKQKFIVTLDGIQKSDIVARLSAKDGLQGRRTPSPIIFEQSSKKPKIQRNIPAELPIVPVTFSKKKEKCKYFPLCKNGTKCEYFHPVKTVQMCEQFPYCKFGDKCRYTHPMCKFGTSCTKRDCSYAHGDGYSARVTAPVVAIDTQITKQICKFFPKCINSNCIFYHPKPCKYGMYCNQSVCNFVHTNVPSKNSLIWKSK